ncbi:MAG: FtsQ-type POTRA domain-containing protein [Candidatus Pacebacteria bacterium]|nr:FtsQ-type POTRA domain-containing protein [Candidatus Paceibacterota bacterium]
MARHYKRYKKIKKRKSIFKRIIQNKFFLLGFFVFLIMGGFFYLFFLSPVFLIHQIQIEGNLQFLSKDEIRDYVERNVIFFGRKNIFGFSKRNLSNFLVESFPPIREVRIKRNLPHKLIIQTEERKPAGIFCESACFFIDKEGIVFYPTESKDLVIFRAKEPKAVRLGKEVIEKTNLVQILNIIEVLKKELDIEIKEVFLSRFEIKFQTKNNISIYFSKKKNFEDQTEDLILLIKREIKKENLNKLEYIDLRFDKIFYKFKET